MKNVSSGFLAAAGIGILASTTHAGPTCHFYITTINATPTGGTWQVYADVSDDNDGLANYYIDVLGGGGVQITSSIQKMAPHVIDPSNQFQDGSGGVMGLIRSTTPMEH